MQPTLFTNPVVHAHDPPTSAKAAADHALSGRRARHAWLVLALVQAHPDLTACELWEAAGAVIQAELRELQEVRRRCTDLEAAGLIRKAGQRRCRVRGTSQVIWRVV